MPATSVICWLFRNRSFAGMLACLCLVWVKRGESWLCERALAGNSLTLCVQSIYYKDILFLTDHPLLPSHAFSVRHALPAIDYIPAPPPFLLPSSPHTLLSSHLSSTPYLRKSLSS